VVHAAAEGFRADYGAGADHALEFVVLCGVCWTVEFS
jgi:hypothetical protein